MTATQISDDHRSGGRLRDVSPIESRVLSRYQGRRLRASRVVQHTDGMATVAGAIDHTLVFHLAGGPVTRFNGSRRTGRAEHPHRTTLIPAHSTVSWTLAEPVETLQLHIDDADLRRFAHRELEIDPDRLEVFDHMSVDDTFMRRLAPVVLDELATAQPSDQLMLESLSAAFAAHILRGYSNAPTLCASRRENTRRQRDRQAVLQVQEMLLDRLDENLTAESLAQEVGMSPFRLMRCFKASMGISIHRFVMESRVELVRSRLQNTDDRLVDIAIDAGFANQSHMTSCYTTMMGISPGRHRRQLRG